MKVRAAGWAIALEPALEEQLRRRCALDRFEAVTSVPTLALRFGRLPADEECGWLDLERKSIGRYVTRTDEIVVEAALEPYRAEAALRVAFQQVLWRQSGILVHAAAFAWGEDAAVAIGESGAGKSTLSRCARAAGARVLSDETVALFPDGTVFGAPFSSDRDLLPSVEPARARVILGLRKAPEEGWAVETPAESVALIVSQSYSPPTVRGSRAELLARAAAISRVCPAATLSFAPRLAAGEFVRERIDALAR